MQSTTEQDTTKIYNKVCEYRKTKGNLNNCQVIKDIMQRKDAKLLYSLLKMATAKEEGASLSSELCGIALDDLDVFFNVLNQAILDQNDLLVKRLAMSVLLNQPILDFDFDFDLALGFDVGFVLDRKYLENIVWEAAKRGYIHFVSTMLAEDETKINSAIKGVIQMALDEAREQAEYHTEDAKKVEAANIEIAVNLVEEFPEIFDRLWKQEELINNALAHGRTDFLLKLAKHKQSPHSFIWEDLVMVALRRGNTEFLLKLVKQSPGSLSEYSWKRVVSEALQPGDNEFVLKLAKQFPWIFDPSNWFFVVRETLRSGHANYQFLSNTGKQSSHSSNWTETSMAILNFSYTECVLKLATQSPGIMRPSDWQKVATEFKKQQRPPAEMICLYVLAGNTKAFKEELGLLEKEDDQALLRLIVSFRHSSIRKRFIRMLALNPDDASQLTQKANHIVQGMRVGYSCDEVLFLMENKGLLPFWSTAKNIREILSAQITLPSDLIDEIRSQLSSTEKPPNYFKNLHGKFLESIQLGMKNDKEIIKNVETFCEQLNDFKSKQNPNAFFKNATPLSFSQLALAIKLESIIRNNMVSNNEEKGTANKAEESSQAIADFLDKETFDLYNQPEIITMLIDNHLLDPHDYILATMDGWKPPSTTAPSSEMKYG